MPVQPKPVPTKARVAGFTLIELMVVVLVAAILVGIAVPSYQSQIRHSRRTDAKTALLDAAVREEKFLTLNNTYTNTASNLGYTGTLPNIQIGSGYYNLNICLGTATVSTASTTPCTGTLTAANPTSFVVSATAIAGTSQAGDTTCLYYAVDNTGAQYSVNSTTGSGTSTASTCWQ